MGKKLLNTPRSKIKNTLRQLWLRSRERATACKRESYTCQICGAKQSRAKGRECYIEVHHKKGIDWEGLIDLVFERLLVNPNDLEVLCVGCHDKKHKTKIEKPSE